MLANIILHFRHSKGDAPPGAVSRGVGCGPLPVCMGDLLPGARNLGPRVKSGRPLKVLLLVMAFFLQLQEGDYVEPDVLNLMDFRVCSPSS